MEAINKKLGKANLVLAAMVILSIVLSVFNYNIRLLAWIDMWGPSMGWVMRIALIVVGGSLFFFLEEVRKKKLVNAK